LGGSKPAMPSEDNVILINQNRNREAETFDAVGDYLVRVTVDGTRVVGTSLGRRNRPHLLEAWGQRFNLQLDDHIALFRYEDVPGMIGRVGSAFGENGINISSAAVGYTDSDQSADEAVMVITTDAPVPQSVMDALVATDGFNDGRAVTLADG